MKFRVIDRRICDYLDYIEIGKKIDKNKSYIFDNNSNKYKVYYKQMSPFEYIKRCADMFGMSIDRLIESRNDDSLKQLKSSINSGNYGIIYIDEYNKMQDGLHRAIVLMMKKVPKINVLIIEKLK